MFWKLLKARHNKQPLIRPGQPKWSKLKGFRCLDDRQSAKHKVAFLTVCKNLTLTEDIGKK